VIQTHRRLWADLSLVGITFIWGSTFVVVKRALDSSSTLAFLALRFSLASLLMMLVFRGRLSPGPDRKLAMRAGAAVGGALFLGYAFQTFGLRLTTASKCGFITGLSVVMVPLINAAIYRAWPSWACWAGVASATGGLYLMAAPAGLAHVSRGDVLTLVAAAAFAFQVVLVGHFSRQTGAPWLSTAQVCVTALLSLGSFWWAETLYVRWTPTLLAALAITAGLATALVFPVQVWAQQFTSPSHAALIFSLEPVFAWLASYVVLGEVLGARGAWGAGLILAGIILAELKPA
jgi:drug/metabolite transporter (DMT)-like permease